MTQIVVGGTVIATLCNDLGLVEERAYTVSSDYCVCTNQGKSKIIMCFF